MFKINALLLGGALSCMSVNAELPPSLPAIPQQAVMAPAQFFQQQIAGINLQMQASDIQYELYTAAYNCNIEQLKMQKKLIEEQQKTLSSPESPQLKAMHIQNFVKDTQKALIKHQALCDEKLFKLRTAARDLQLKSLESGAAAESVGFSAGP